MRLFIYSSILCFFAFHAQSQIVINEISYNPPESGNDSLEYIELYNAGNTQIDITGWYFTRGVNDTLPSVQLKPGEYFVTAINAGAMMNVFHIVVHQWSNGALNNGGEQIVLVDALGNIMDSLTYRDADPWPTEPDGNGPSLELNSPVLDNSIGTNWHASTALTGVIINGREVAGTPGAQNSDAILPGFPVLKNNAITMSPNPAVQLLTFQSDYILTSVMIYALDGKLVLTNAPNAKDVRLSIDNLQDGMYNVRIMTDAGVWNSLLSVVR